MVPIEFDCQRNIWYPREFFLKSSFAQIPNHLVACSPRWGSRLCGGAAKKDALCTACLHAHQCIERATCHFTPEGTTRTADTSEVCVYMRKTALMCLHAPWMCACICYPLALRPSHDGHTAVSAQNHESVMTKTSNNTQQGMHAHAGQFPPVSVAAANARSRGAAAGS